MSSWWWRLHPGGVDPTYMPKTPWISLRYVVYSTMVFITIFHHPLGDYVWVTSDPGLPNLRDLFRGTYVSPRNTPWRPWGVSLSMASWVTWHSTKVGYGPYIRYGSYPFGCFQKWWVSPTTMGFPTKNDHFGVFWGYHYFWKHPFITFGHV